MAVGDSTVNVTIGATLAKTFTTAFYNAEKTTKKLGAAVTQLNRATGNIKNLKRTQLAVNRANKEYKEAKKALDALNRRLKSGEHQTEQFTDEWVQAQDRFEKSRIKLKRLNQELHNAKKAAGNAKASTTSLINKERSLEAQLRRTQQMQERYNRTLQRSNQLKERSQKLAMGGAALGASAYVAGRVIGAPIRTGMEFGTAASNVKAIANQKGDFNTLEEAQEALVTKIKELGATTSYTSAQVAAGAKYLTMAGFDISKTIGALPATLSLARAGDLDLAQTADIMTNIMSPFGIDASKSERVADIMAKVVTTSNTDISMLGETMKYVAAVSSSMGVSLSDTAAIAGVLASNGIQASMAGTTMKNVFLRLAAPADKAKKKLAELGVTTKDAMGNLRAPEVILQELGDALKNAGLGGGEQTEYLEAIFGKISLSGAQFLVKAAGNGQLQDYMKEVYNAEEGLSKSIAGKQLDNLKGDLDIFGSAVSGLFLSIYDPIKTTLRATVQSFTVVINKIRDWTLAHPMLTKAIMLTAIGLTTLTAGIATAMLVTSAYLFVKSKLLKVWAAAALSMDANIARFKALNVAVLTGIGRVKAYTVAQYAAAKAGIYWAVTNPLTAIKAGWEAGIASLSAAKKGLIGLATGFAHAAKAGIMFMVTNPIGWIAAAVAAASFLIIKFWQPIKAMFSGIGEGIMDTLSPAIAALSPLWTVLKQIGSAIKTLFGDVFSNIQFASEELTTFKAVGFAIGKIISIVLTPVEYMLYAIGKAAEIATGVLGAGAKLYNWVFGEDEEDSEGKKTTSEFKKAKDRIQFAEMDQRLFGTNGFGSGGYSSAYAAPNVESIQINVNGSGDPNLVAEAVMRRQQEEIARIERERND